MKEIKTNGKNGVAVNVDGDLFWWMYESVNGNVENFEQKIRTYVKGYAGNGISDLFFCCFTQVSTFPTKVLDWWGDKYYQTVENGTEVDYTKLNRVKHIVDMYGALGTDPFDILISETRKNGMKAWISIRMNDHHYQKQKTSYTHGDLYYTAKERGWFIGEECGGDAFSECYDYGVEYIREKMFDYVCEVLDRYDTDGIELDFMREIYCFDYLHNTDCCEIMTAFVEKVRGYLRKKEAERGHKIRLCVRLNRSPYESKIFGFDAAEWIKRGLVDVIVPTSRWFSTDTDMPVSEWKKLVRNSGVEIYAGLESFLFHPVQLKEEAAKGLTVQYIDAGADKIYLYNFFRTCVQPEDKADEICLFKGDDAYPTNALSERNERDLKKIWQACSDVETARKGTRRHIMSYQEPHATPIGVKGYRPLPAKINGEATFTLQTGKCTEDDCVLILGIKAGSDLPEIVLDGNKAKCFGTTDDAYTCDRNNSVFNSNELVGTVYYKYGISVSGDNVRNIAVNANSAIVTYLEIKVGGK